MLAAAGDTTAVPVLGAMAFGFVVALIGHIAGSRFVVGVGIALLFVATALMVVGGYVAYQDGPPDPKCNETPGAFRDC